MPGVIDYEFNLQLSYLGKKMGIDMKDFSVAPDPGAMADGISGIRAIYGKILNSSDFIADIDLFQTTPKAAVEQCFESAVQSGEGYAKIAGVKYSGPDEKICGKGVKRWMFSPPEASGIADLYSLPYKCSANDMDKDDCKKRNLTDEQCKEEACTTGINKCKKLVEDKTKACETLLIMANNADNPNCGFKAVNAEVEAQIKDPVLAAKLLLYTNRLCKEK